MLSCLLPSKLDPQYGLAGLARLIRSFQENMSSPDAEVEMIVAVDYDDRETLRFCSDIKIVKIHRVSPGRSIVEYFNDLHLISKGTHFLLLNDDCELMTPGFDVEACKVPQGWYGKTICHSADPFYSGLYAEFPVLTKSGVEAVGWLLPPTFRAWGADEVLWRMYNTANRIKDCEIKIRHLREIHGSRFARMSKLSGEHSRETIDTFPYGKFAAKLTASVQNENA